MERRFSRKHGVQINRTSSDWADVNTSDWADVIPQGSVLDQTLFLVYINDFPDVVHSLVKLYADDANIFAVVHTVNDVSLVQGDLHNVDDRILENKI